MKNGKVRKNNNLKLTLSDYQRILQWFPMGNSEKKGPIFQIKSGKVCLTTLFGCLPSISTEDCYPVYLKDRRGNITNEKSRLLYPTNACEVWYISGKVNDTVTISISQMNITTSRNGSCNKYYLSIGQNPSRIYCGSERQVYVSTTGHVIIKYRSLGSLTGLGFHLKYIIVNVKSSRTTTLTTTPVPQTHTVHCHTEELFCVSKETLKNVCLKRTALCDEKIDCIDGKDEEQIYCASKCNQYFIEDTGHITSPSYPYEYPNNINCQWTIHIQDTRAKIQLRFESFNVQSSADTDYLIIYNGTDIKAPVLGKYYGRNPPPKILESSSNWVFIKFVSDGHVTEKGFSLTYQKKGVCLSTQNECDGGEKDCYEKHERCDGVWNCREHGGDEKGCLTCKLDYYTCGPHTSQCYQAKERCNGEAHCSNRADEYNCTSVQCGTHNGTFLCDNKHCIYETWQCDKTNDCDDNSDEINCPHTTNLIKIAAVAGSLICSLLLVVALGCTCKLYNLRMQQFHGPRYETPLSRLYAEFMRRRAPPPYHEAMLTSRPYEEARREYLERLAGNGRTSSRHGRRSRHRPSRSRSHLQQVNENDPSSPSALVESPTQSNDSSTQNSNDSHIPSATGGDNSVNRTHVNIDRQSSQTALINNSDSESSESDLENNQTEEVQVEFSDDTGLSAHWRRNARIKQDSDSEQDTRLQEIPPNTVTEEVCSIDNTIASCDSVDTPKTDDNKNTSEINICDNNNPTSSSNSNNRSSELQRHPSQSSLNSSGSESTSWGDFVA
ncbi:hypothetical protein KUTeg_019572 [Tegillarca granosa]|uniref:CUB domain-containing protein n=1 Tax=Tegillarca granosa TaxID=220873 RepID=A0ABQ9EH61_TEGGR|nr:hypothetical protein KUTeg_019572 [Tegillarca granosa]